jgi:transcription elongation factor Elf1
MNWLEQKYVSLLSHRLERFTRKGSGKFNFRCPICGDSQSNKSKARGWIYGHTDKSSFHCFNCSASMSVPRFIKTIDANLYSEFMMEKMRDGKSPGQIDLEQFVNKMKPPVFRKEGPLKGLKKVSQLRPEHPIKQYVVKRKIPNEYHAKLFVCPNFMQYCNSLLPDKFSESALKRDETRLLIPFIDEKKQVHAFQGRSMGSSSVKYITIVLDEEVPKVYGLDALDKNRTTYVFEGPIDSMFIPNSIATAGGDIVSALRGFDKSKLVIVYDNEPRSRETIKKLDKAIMQGYSVCIWPENLEHKDVNDMVMAGLSSNFIGYIIDQNIHRDLAAKLALKNWSRV